MANKRKKTTEDSSMVQVVETKAQKMKRLGDKRVAKTLQSIRLIGNLAAYKPTEKQIDEIMTALGSTCAKVEQRLRGTTQESYNFTLSQ